MLRRLNLQQKLIVGLALLTINLSAQAAQVCALNFLAPQSAKVREIVAADAYMQWLDWEQNANFKPFRQSGEPKDLPAMWVSSSELKVEFTEAAPLSLRNKLTKDGNVLWLKHPFNQSTEVPFFDQATSGNEPAYFTASRSMAFSDPELRGFTIKLPTDHPFGPKGDVQVGKANTSDDVLVAILHSNHIHRQDLVRGQDSILRILPEAATVFIPDTGIKNRIGMVIRDVRQLDDGNYYLPALSIPYVGRAIAELNGQKFEDFWGINYANLLGEAKAKLLLRYGLQMETPNSQNMLIQFDRNLKPTGKIVFRDVSDAVFVEGVTQSLGFKAELTRDIKVDFKPHDYIQPFWSNSSWRFDEAGQFSISKKTLGKWGVIHNEAYANTIARELGFDLNSVGVKFQSTKDDFAPDLYNFLNSLEGKKLLEEYRNKSDPASHQQAA